MANEKGPGDARAWVGDEAKRILTKAERLLTALTAFHQKATKISSDVDSAAKAAATQLTLPPNTPKSNGSPLLNQIAVTVEAAGHLSPAVTLALAARLQEHRAVELLPSATELRDRMSNLVAVARPTASRLRFAFKGKDGKTQGIDALKSLEQVLTRVEAQGLHQALANFAASTPLLPEALTPELEAWAHKRIGRALGLTATPGERHSVGGPDLLAVRTLAREGGVALAQRPALVASVKKSFTAVQDRMVDRQLQEIPVERLKDAAGGRIRFKTLGDAQIATVYASLHPRSPLASIHGISETMAHQVTAAALQVAQAVRDDLRFRIDLDKTDSLVTGLLTDLKTLLRFDSFFDGNAEQLQQATDYLAPILSAPTRSTAIALFAQP